MDYLMPSGHGKAEYVEKRSRFLGSLAGDHRGGSPRPHRKDEGAVRDARHNCWCCLIRGEDGQAAAVRYADDGEPQGTAGLPMLEVFAAVVWKTYCAGHALFRRNTFGRGRLSRAYSHAAKLALEAAGVAEMRSPDGNGDNQPLWSARSRQK
jgi:putative IMPACT (imprinted ancient) family translation regulator